MRKLTLAALSAAAAGVGVKRIWKEKLSAEQNRADENESLSHLYYHWLLFKQNGGDFAHCLSEKALRDIAIFGMSPLGRRFAEEFAPGGPVDIRYAIERDLPGAVHPRFDVLRLRDDPLPLTDAVIVCQIRDCDTICRNLRALLGDRCQILTLEQVIMDALARAGLGPRDGVLK